MRTRTIKILEEFCGDVRAAHGSNGQSDEEIFDSLNAYWPDLAVTWRKAEKALIDEGKES